MGFAALMPHTCVLCRRRSRRDIDLCLECEQAFERNAPACPVCAEPMPSAAAGPCAACLVAPPPWRRAIAPFTYEWPLSRLIGGLKSGNGVRQARILGAVLAPFVRAAYRDAALPEALVAMPLTRRRLRQRGFNQAQLLADSLGRRLEMPRLRRRLVRIRNAPPQRSLPRSARLGNMRGAFAVRRPLAACRVALLDDVATTGATARAASEALLAAGAEEVHLWVAAKTP